MGILTSKDGRMKEWAVFKRYAGTILIGKDRLMKEWAVCKRIGKTKLIRKGLTNVGMGSIKGKSRNNTKQAVLKRKRGTIMTSMDGLMNEWAVCKRNEGTILIGKDGLM